MYSDIHARWLWRPIPNCPGRFVLSTGPTRLGPEVFAGESTTTEHVVSTAKDPVLVTRFADGGLISYRKADGTYLHTLNTPEGFERKLKQLGIETTA